MLIRKYKEDDRSRILEILCLNTPAFFSPLEEKDLEYYLSNHADNFYVVEKDNKVVCCGGYNLADDPTIARISWDIVDPDCQGMGYGSELTNFRINKMKEIPGVKTISVRTSQLAYKYYERFGFKVKEEIKDYWAPGFDLVRMDLE